MTVDQFLLHHVCDDTWSLLRSSKIDLPSLNSRSMTIYFILKQFSYSIGRFGNDFPQTSWLDCGNIHWLPLLLNPLLCVAGESFWLARCLVTCSAEGSRHVICSLLQTWTQNSHNESSLQAAAVLLLAAVDARAFQVIRASHRPM